MLVLHPILTLSILTEQSTVVLWTDSSGRNAAWLAEFQRLAVLSDLQSLCHGLEVLFELHNSLLGLLRILVHQQ